MNTRSCIHVYIYSKLWTSIVFFEIKRNDIYIFNEFERYTRSSYLSII